MCNKKLPILTNISKFFLNFFSKLLEAVTHAVTEGNKIEAEFKCVQKPQANLVAFRAQLRETFSQQPDPIHPPLHLDCSLVQ